MQTRHAVLFAALIAMPATGMAKPHRPPAVPDYIVAAVASPLRAPRDVARDATQQPAALLAFAGVKPGDRVADLWPTPPYSTALLSGVVGNTGKVYAIVPPKLFQDVPPAEAKVREALAPYTNVVMLVQAFDRIAVPEPLDIVWLGKIYHDFPNAAEMGPLSIADVDRALFAALKPGGTLIVVDHAATPGSGFRDTDADDAKRVHRIDPDVVKAELKAAGFRFEASLPLLANPADDHRKSAFDPAIRDHTDRFILKFRKPG